MATKFNQGTFRGMGGDIIINVDILPDPDLVAAQLLEVADGFENIILPLTAAKRLAQQDIQAHFDSESTPDGDRWTALDINYARYKESLGYPEDILHRTGKLEKAATSDAAFTIIGDAIFFNWDALPTDESGEYNLGALHQEGTSQGPFLRGERSNLSREEVLSATTATGRGKNLPPRPFVGLSQLAELEVYEAFDLWFDETVNIAINPRTGVVQERLPSGLYGKKLF